MTTRPNTTSDSTPQASFAQVIGSFADAVTDNFKQLVSAQPEDQLKAPVGDLLRQTGGLTGLTVAWRTEVRPDDVDGRPDLGVTVKGLLTGLVELKRPGLGAQPEHFTERNRAQWERFKALPNLIYTDGAEWSLYRSGELRLRARIAADITQGGTKAVDQESFRTIRELLRDFLYWEPIVPATAEGLAKFLAPLTRVLRDDVNAALMREGSSLRALANEWSGLLFPEGDDAQFADAYAQTLTYALLLARFEGAESLRPAIAVDALQREHGLLAEALQLLEAPAVRGELRMPIELLERAIQAVDSVKLDRAGDPWLYFYEDFLDSYDPKLRRDRGVYFTPVEVVRAQVTLAAELLRTRFGKRLGFADDDVVVLDPAVGTGTYPLAVLDHASTAVERRFGPGAVAGKLRNLAERLYAFEVLVGPYSIAHLRLSQSLRNAGVTDKPPKVYLTDALESPNHPPQFSASLLQAQLTEERKRAQRVKKDVRVFVCLGNPPYDREEQEPEEATFRRKGGWVRYGDDEQEGVEATAPILEDFLAPAREAGAGVHLKNLYNDYVYFWRWALWKVLDSTEEPGIVTFITASSYLRGPGFAGMRQKMREVFDELWLIDLEGSTLGPRKTENVFAIRTPVAIAIGVRNGPPQPETPANVWKIRLTGSEQAKLAALNAVVSFADLDWRECSPEWRAPFYPAETGRFAAWPAVTDVFPWQHSGTQLKRTWPIGETKDILNQRWRHLMAMPAKKMPAAFRETGDRKVSGRYPALLGDGGQQLSLQNLHGKPSLPTIVRYSYRSFDRQWVIADSRVGDRMRPELWRSHSQGQVYMTSLLTAVLGHGPAAVASSAIPDLDHFRGSFGAKHAIPLWRDVKATKPNVTKGFLETLAVVHKTPVSAKRLFTYVYGILAQPAYVERFWDELEMPPPRVPITKDVKLFRRVAEHGRRLLYLHTYGERFRGRKDDGSVPQGQARCTKAVSLDNYPKDYFYDPTTQVLRVGDGEFFPVSPAVWDYSVSGLQVVKSWLDRRKLDRSGRKSSPLDDIRPKRWEFTEELLELLWVLEATLALQPEGAALLEEVCRSQLFSKDELPTPSKEEQQPPKRSATSTAQLGLIF